MRLFKSKRVLAMDIGAAQLKLAEFAVNKAGIELTNLAVCPMGIEPGADADHTMAIIEAIQTIMKEKAIRPGPVVLTVTGALMRQIKLPPVKRNKIYQTILYEAQQNVPFPMDQVMWDYALMGSSANELNVMLAVIKKDIVENLTDCVEAVGLEVEIVDVAPVSLYNTVRYNYGELKGCTLVVDIGAHSTDLIFMEEGRCYLRPLPLVGTGDVITQQLMKKFDMSFKDTEELKYAHASVAFGGSYEDYSDKVLSNVSKTVRGVMTRLHVEMERSINFYRTQQDGANPNRMFLAGGTSVIARTDEFFKEKLKIDVEYLNPFRNIIVNESISEEVIGSCAHVMGETVGAALRYAGPCPLEINLLPPKIMAVKNFKRKQPFLVAAAAGLVLTVLCWWFFFHTMTQRIAVRRDAVQMQVDQLEAVAGQLKPIEARQAEITAKAEMLADMPGLRTQWIEVLNGIHACMSDGMWLVSFVPVAKDAPPGGEPAPDNEADAARGRRSRRASAAAGPEGGPAAWTHVRVKGLIFSDKAADGSIAEFRDRLRQLPLFTENTEIVLAPALNLDDYARQFTIEIGLRYPL